MKNCVADTSTCRNAAGNPIPAAWYCFSDSDSHQRIAEAIFAIFDMSSQVVLDAGNVLHGYQEVVPARFIDQRAGIRLRSSGLDRQTNCSPPVFIENGNLDGVLR